MSHTTKHLTIQVLLITFGVFVVIIARGPVVSSQGVCAQPPYSHTPKYVSAWARLPGFPDSLPRPVNVKIDTAFGTGVDKQALVDGISSWNGKTCSGISFYGFESMDFPNYSVVPPDSTLYVMKHNAGGLIAAETSFNPPNGMATAAKIEIRPDIVNVFSGSYFFHLAAHETGHSF